MTLILFVGREKVDVGNRFPQLDGPLCSEAAADLHRNWPHPRPIGFWRWPVRCNDEPVTNYFTLLRSVLQPLSARGLSIAISYVRLQNSNPMTVRLLVPLEIARDAEAFANEWNRDRDALKIGSAAVEPRPPVFDGGALWEGLSFVLTNVALGVTANMVYDVVRKRVERKKLKRKLEVIETTNANGDRTLRVVLEECL